MNQRLLKYKEVLSKWTEAGRNYSPPVDWIDLNQIATDLGNGFNIGCGSCRSDLCNFIMDVIKERGI